MSKYIFNITELEREGSEPLLLEFYGGDITSVYSDVLLTSSFKADYNPIEGTVLGRIKERFGIEFTDGLPEEAIRISPGLHDFNSDSTEAYKRLWVLEIASHKNDPNMQSDVFKAYSTLEKLIEKIEYLNIESISIPVLGTGSQGLNYQEATTKLVGIIKNWSLKSKKLKTVRLFAYNIEAAANLNNAIDTFFGIKQEPVNDYTKKLLHASKEELYIKKNEFDDRFHDGIEELFCLLNSNTPSAKSIAISGRILAEHCTEFLINIWYPSIDVTELNLNSRIVKIQEKIKSERPWILSYLRLLQTSGNYGAHKTAKLLNLIDAVAVIIAVLRVSEYTNEKIISLMIN